jgi:phage pi2 protein 07
MFNILNYADQLEFVAENNTQLTYRCPVCFSKLQVSKRKLAYMCVSDCSSSDIRAHLDIPRSADYFPKVYVAPKPIPLPRKINLHKCNAKYDLEQQHFFHPKYEESAVKTIYNYSPHHRIVRMDLLESGEKMFYPNKKIDGRWQIVADEQHPFFNEDKIHQKDTFVTLVEGEKCAVELSKQGILAITPPPFGWGENRLEEGFKRLYYDIDGVLVIPDNDIVGLKKAVRVQNACWRVGLPCRILNLEDYYCTEKEDVADLIKRGLNINEVIRDLL